MDWSEKNSCIKCDDGGNLLVCNENGCPISVHMGCLGCLAKFDESGRFYCPYCLYKQAVAELRNAREYALARKKALLAFMDEKVIGCEENGHNQSKASEENGNTASREDGKSKSEIIDQRFRLDGEEKVSNADEDSADSKREDPSVEMVGGKSNRTEEETRVQEDEDETSAEEEQIQDEEREALAQKQIQEEEHETKVDEEQIQEEEHETSAEEEQIQEEKHETSAEEQIQREEHKRRKQHDKKLQRSRRSSAAMGTGKASNEGVGSPRRLRKSEQPSVKLVNDVFGSAKRKRLMWTEEEEDTLRAGVKKYSRESNVIPWKKILDIGKHTFNATRTPADLKDKWRNMPRK